MGSGSQITAFRELINNSPVGMALFDSEFRYVIMNKRLSQLDNIDPEQVIGKKIGDVIPYIAERVQPILAEVIATGQQVVGREVVVQEGAPLKKFRFLRVSYIPITGDDDEKFVGAVIEDITEQRAAWVNQSALVSFERKRREGIEVVSRSKDEFLATFVHELRTPLNAILGWAQLLRRKEFSPELIAKALDVIENNARAQATLIDSLLQASAQHFSNQDIGSSVISLSSVLRNAAQTLEPAAMIKDVSLDIDINIQDDAICGDPTRLQQVFWNLLVNAIRFTPAGGKILVTTLESETTFSVAVADTGAGIKQDLLADIFTKFKQGHNEVDGANQSLNLGLGLAIVRDIVETHGGTVQATSDGPGKGATFTVTLPKAHTFQAGLINRIKPCDNLLPLEGITALVVDDDADSVFLTQHTLTLAGAKVVTANSCEAALEKLSYVHPDIIISDLGMPVADGYDLIHSLRQLPDDEGGKTPAIALSGFIRNDNLTEPISAGYQMALAKPLDPDGLVRAVRLISRTQPTKLASVVNQ